MDTNNGDECLVKCPICGRKAEPSKDHIPPKSCGNKGNKIIQYFFISHGKRIEKKASNGVYFETICSDCNNGLLGGKYDKKLKEFYEFVCSDKNDILCWKGDITQIIKSVFGHMLALYHFTNAEPDKAMRKYLLRDILPENYSLNLFYYPYDAIFFAKNSMPLQFFKREKSIIPKQILSTVLYFYPFAFMLSYKKKFQNGIDLIELVKNKTSKLKLNKNSWKNYLTEEILPPCWPFEISENHSNDTVDSVVGGAEMESLAIAIDCSNKTK